MTERVRQREVKKQEDVKRKEILNMKVDALKKALSSHDIKSQRFKKSQLQNLLPQHAGLPESTFKSYFACMIFLCNFSSSSDCGRGEAL
jgi:hypothetical protein